MQRMKFFKHRPGIKFDDVSSIATDLKEPPSPEAKSIILRRMSENAQAVPNVVHSQLMRKRYNPKQAGNNYYFINVNPITLINNGTHSSTEMVDASRSDGTMRVDEDPYNDRGSAEHYSLPTIQAGGLNDSLEDLSVRASDQFNSIDIPHVKSIATMQGE